MKELSIPISTDTSQPIYEQIYEFIKKEIRHGSIEARQKLPSTRALSKHLNVSRSTIQLAYDQLVSEGYVESVACKGYFVMKIDGLYNLEAAQKEEKLTSTQESLWDYDFSPNGIDLSGFPYNSWRKISRNVMLMEEMDLFNIGDSKGDYEFRETIARYLHESRGVNCSASNIILGAGNEYLLMLIDRLLGEVFGRDVSYAMENPTYLKAYTVLKDAGRQMHAIGLDENGMKPDRLEQSQADIAYVTPSHQYPLGIVMSIGRRMELLAWAGSDKRHYIIEDDYDSEFRYRGKPIPSLQGYDKHQKVIYIGTFSKSIAPGIRMSYMVLPPSLMESYEQIGRHYSNTVSRLDQQIVNMFIKEGYYERHLNRMRALYKNKHDVLMSSLKMLGRNFEVNGDSAGLHVLLSSDELTEQQMIERAAAVGIKVYPLSGYYIDNVLNEDKIYTKATIILGYARLTEQEIVDGVARLAEVYNGKNM